jgi:hypothetical protein
MKITDLPNYSVVSKSRKPTIKEEQKPEDNDGLVMDFAQGVAKSAGDIALGVGSLGRKIQGGISKAVGAVTGVENFGMGNDSVFDKDTEARKKADELLKRDTIGEKVGGFVGDVASFALPGGAVVRGSKGANLLTRAGALGASDAVVTTARSGEFNREAVDAAIIGAAFPVVGKGAQLAKGMLPSSREAGGKVINSLVKPLLKDFSYGKNPGQAIADAGIVANSLDDLAAKIKVVRQETGEEISQRVAQSTARFDGTNSLAPLDQALTIAQKSPRTNAPIIRRLEDIKADILRVGEDGLPTRKLTDLSADELWELNKDIGELARWTGNATDDEIVNKAIRSAYSNTRSNLEKGVPGLDEVSEKYANLKSAETATEYRDKIAARQGLISFSGTQLGTAAAITSAVVSGGAVIPILVGATAAAGTEALKSPAVKTRVAAWLAGASKKEIQDAFYQAPWLRGAIQTELLGGEEE